MKRRTSQLGANPALQIGKTQRGFSLLELILVLVIAMVFMGMAIIMTRSVLAEYRHRNAVVSVTTAIQATRFQAIRNGIPFAVQFNPANNTYQVSRRPAGAAAFVNVGTPAPLEGGAQVVISAATRLEFSPNGMVQATVGAMNFNISYGPRVRTITVSRVGHVTVQ